MILMDYGYVLMSVVLTPRFSPKTFDKDLSLKLEQNNKIDFPSLGGY